MKTSGIHGIVLDGISGSGKSFIGRILQRTCPFDSIYKDSVEIFINSKIGGIERELENIFSSSEQAKLIILDNAESIFSSNPKDSADQMGIFSSDPVPLERKIFLFSKYLIDKLNRESKVPIFIIAIVPDKNVVPAEIRFPGRFNHSFNVNISKFSQREEVLREFLKDWPFESDNYREECVKILGGQPTSGFTPADIESLLQRTLELRNAEEPEDGPFKLDDFINARHFVNPSSIVAHLTKIPQRNVKIVGLDEQLETIQQYLSAIFRNDPTVPLPRGILLEGPSGCGKSLLASKLSNFQIDALKFPVNFISVDSTQIISKYFGQSDRNLSKIFSEARQAAPCILFFDQIDTLVRKRGNSGGSETDDRLVTTFLIEMDGLKSKMSSSDCVIVLGTTSNKKLIDPAILRPGRLDLHVNIPLPNEETRLEFIKSFMSRAQDKFRLSANEISLLLTKTDGFSFAELDSLFKEAAMTALREDLNCSFVEFRHFKV